MTKKLQIRNSTAELFDVDVRTINEHLQNLFISNELDKISVIRNFRITASDGKNYNTQFYNLDAIISVGYRVNSVRATQFRQWAYASELIMLRVSAEAKNMEPIVRTFCEYPIICN